MKTPLLTSLIIMTSVLLSAQTDEPFQAETYTGPDGNTLNYRIYVPEGDGPFPLVLFFHGAGERGDDNTAQLKHGARDLLKYTQESDQPAIIIAPQCPRGQQWVNTPWKLESHTMPEDPSEPMTLAWDLLQEKIKELPVDPSRIYVTGLSMGGFGTWDIIQRHPGTFAAAIAVCGGGDTAMAPVIKDVPIWAFHGDKDTVVLTKRSRDMVEALRAAGGSPHYTEYPGVGHGSWGRAYSDTEALDWFFQQKKD